MTEEATPGGNPSGGNPPGGNPPAHVQVVRGAPDEVELAALVAGLAAAGGSAPDEPPVAPNAWTDRSRSLQGPAGPRPPFAPGADAWRWSLRG